MGLSLGFAAANEEAVTEGAVEDQIKAGELVGKLPTVSVPPSLCSLSVGLPPFVWVIVGA